MKRKIIVLWSVNRTVVCFDPSPKNSFSVRGYIIAVHCLTSEGSLKSACVNSVELAEKYLSHCVIVIRLHQCQSLRRRT